MDLILTHQNCPDGWAAAYVCKLKYPEAEIMPLNHGLLPAALDELMIYATGKDVIMVDYSLRTRELNDQLNSVAKSFRILDHHKTAQAVLEGATYATFDMKRSGAGLAWDYLFGKDSPELADVTDSVKSYRPYWVNYAEDQDLWNWALPHSQEINAYLMVQSRDIETWNKITKMSKYDVAEKGKGVRAYIEYYTRSVVAEAQEGLLMHCNAAFRTAVLNIPYAGVSEAGNALCKAGYPVALLWFERGDGMTTFSLRGDGSVDVSAIAKSFNGGGHHNAAGFQLSLYDGRLLVDKVLGRTNLRNPGGCIK
jgi:uncharacterized protein